MKRRKIICRLIALVIVFAVMTGCSSDVNQPTSAGAGLDKLGEIVVVSREVGSGTREIFVNNIGIYDSATGVDKTRSDAVVSVSSEDVIDVVGKNKSAIGYVSKGVLEKSISEQIHEVTVDGRSGLERSFYIAYSGQLSELEQDFITYVTGAGQEIVSRNYTAVKKRVSFLSSKPSGRIRIGGSSSVAGLMQELADDYMKKNPNASIEIVVTDSTEGLTGAMSGSYDLAMSSRDLKDYEQELLSYESIAKDEIKVIVHRENPLNNITSEDLKAIYIGFVQDWNDLIAK